jgi:hypothetical protein
MAMTPEQYREFKSSMFDALQKDGISPHEVDIRVHGSGANYFTSDRKPFDLNQIRTNPTARARLEEWLGEGPYPAHHMFGSRYKLGLDDKPSDYDVNLSSDKIVQAAKARWDARAAAGRPYKGSFYATDEKTGKPAHGYVNKKLVEDTFRTTHKWALNWSKSLGRDVSWAVFGSSGPTDTSATGVSVHFRQADWIMHSPGGS